MGKRLDAPLTVIASDPRIVDAPKGQIVVQKLDRLVIDAGTARAGVGNDALGASPIIAPNVQRQRLRCGVYPVYDLVDLRIQDDWQKRSENFLLHDLCISRDIADQCR